MKVKNENEREYHVTIVDSEGKEIIEFFGIVYKKEQTKGWFSVTGKVEETLHVKDYDFKVYPPFQQLLQRNSTNRMRKAESWNIDADTIENTNFRKVIFTGEHAQLVLMNIEPDCEIGTEVHELVDQFFRVERGEVHVLWGENLQNDALLSEGFAMMIPARTKHNVINNSNAPCHLYTIYSPPNHADGLVQRSPP